ncbi:hypothetical protein Bca4012_075836 [Brassica carinata]
MLDRLLFRSGPKYYGEETLVTFEYEELENICSICNSLTHSSRDCQDSGRSSLPAPKSTKPKRADSATVNRPYNPRSSFTKSHSNATKSPEKEEGRHTAFHQRLGRDGRAFDDCVSYPSHQTKPLKNKIVPSYSIDQPAQQYTSNRRDDFHRGNQMRWREKTQTQNLSPIQNQAGRSHNTPPPPPPPQAPALPLLRPLGRNLEICD